MSLSLYLAFVFASVLLILVPGPNVTLIVATSLRHGVARGLLTVAGTSAAMVLQLALTVAGLTALLHAIAGWFEMLRWAGVVYLIVLGVRAWRERPHQMSDDATPLRGKTFLYGFLVSLANPKTLFFFGAFLPQFASPGPMFEAQLLLLAGTFLMLAVVLDSAWAVAASHARRWLGRTGRLVHWLAGGALIGAGVGLALTRSS